MDERPEAGRWRRKSDGAVGTPEQMVDEFEARKGRKLTPEERTLLLAETELMHDELER